MQRFAFALTVGLVVALPATLRADSDCPSYEIELLGTEVSPELACVTVTNPLNECGNMYFTFENQCSEEVLLKGDSCGAVCARETDCDDSCTVVPGSTVELAGFAVQPGDDQALELGFRRSAAFFHTMTVRFSVTSRAEPTSSGCSAAPGAGSGWAWLTALALVAARSSRPR